jgi:hypothetical protein
LKIRSNIYPDSKTAKNRIVFFDASLDPNNSASAVATRAQQLNVFPVVASQGTSTEPDLRAALAAQAIASETLKATISSSTVHH